MYPTCMYIDVQVDMATMMRIRMKTMMRMRMKTMMRMRMNGDKVDELDEDLPAGFAKCILPLCTMYIVHTRTGRNCHNDQDEDEDDDEVE